MRGGNITSVSIDESRRSKPTTATALNTTAVSGNVARIRQPQKQPPRGLHLLKLLLSHYHHHHHRRHMFIK